MREQGERQDSPAAATAAAVALAACLAVVVRESSQGYCKEIVLVTYVLAGCDVWPKRGETEICCWEPTRRNFGQLLSVCTEHEQKRCGEPSKLTITQTAT